MGAWLLAEIQTSFAPPWNAVTEKAVFGALDAEEIVSAIDAACRDGLGARLRDGFLYEVSSGVVVGCELVDGRRVILKAYQRRWTPGFLTAVKTVQRHLYAAGYPSPEPLEPELRIGDAHALVEAVLPDPGIGSPTDDARHALALGLARLIDLCRDTDAPGLAEHPLRRPHEAVFPEPHSPMLDFEATRRGAEWIEELAVRARRLLEADRSAPVIAHTDWSLRNVRVDKSGPVAVYDWDSLALVREAEAIAFAATTWCKAGTPGDITPTLHDIHAFAADYETASSKPLGQQQRESFNAAVVSALAYTARCEHAIDPHETAWTTTRPRLREATSLLE